AVRARSARRRGTRLAPVGHAHRRAVVLARQQRAEHARERGGAHAPPGRRRPVHALAGALPAGAGEAAVTTPAHASEHAEPSQPPRSLVELLALSVQRYAARTLFLTKREGRWVETTFAAFGALVDAVRSGLAQVGVGAGDRVGIIAGNCVEWAAVAYA